MIILKSSLRNGFDDVNWINLAQDRDKWRPLVNALMNFRIA